MASGGSKRSRQNRSGAASFLASIASAAALLVLSTSPIAHQDALAAYAPSAGSDLVNRAAKGDFATLWVGRSTGAIGADGAPALAAIVQPPSATEVPRTGFMPDLPGPIVLGALFPPTGAVTGTSAAVGFAYAPAETRDDLEAPFRAVLGETDIALPRARPALAAVSPNAGADHPWVANAVPETVQSADEQHCLAEAIYFEARGESIRGQIAVAQVIMNRVKNPAYPDTVCGVVYQDSERPNRCQFSFTCDGIPNRVVDEGAWAVANLLATDVTTGETEWLPEVGSSTNYHAAAVNPRWAANMIQMTRIGDHLFYRTRSGGLR